MKQREALHMDYRKHVEYLPTTGGSKNPMCHSLYDSIACFAYWEAMPEEQRESVEEFNPDGCVCFNGATIVSWGIGARSKTV